MDNLFFFVAHSLSVVQSIKNFQIWTTVYASINVPGLTQIASTERITLKIFVRDLAFFNETQVYSILLYSMNLGAAYLFVK
jgi:hypothetical protein